MKLWKGRGCLCASLLRVGKRGFAIMEIVLLLVVIGIIGVNIMLLQNTTWKRTGSSNHCLIAGQMIERQIEKLRMTVDADPENNFPPDSSSLTENGITLKWDIDSAYRPNRSGDEAKQVRKCDLTAWWGTSKGDTLKVSTYIAKNF